MDFPRFTPPDDSLGRAAEVSPGLRRRVRTVGVSALVFGLVLVAVACVVLAVAPEDATIRTTGPRGRSAPRDGSPLQMFIPPILPLIFGGLLLVRPMELLRHGPRATRNCLIALVVTCVVLAVMEASFTAEVFGHDPFPRP